jgi:hypothetical protein
MDRKAELEKHLTWIDGALADADPNVMAGLLRERRITVNELASAGAVMGSVRNDLTAAREKRRAAAAAAAQGAAGRGKQRSG